MLAAWKIKLAIAAALLAAAIGYHMLAVASAKREGYYNAIADMAVRNAEAAENVRNALARVRACRDRGGTWSQSRGVCN
jgi:hypothetical protein